MLGFLLAPACSMAGAYPEALEKQIRAMKADAEVKKDMPTSLSRRSLRVSARGTSPRVSMSGAATNSAALPRTSTQPSKRFAP